MTSNLAYRFLIDGKVVSAGQTITSFRGEPFTFQGVHHPRKIVAAPAGEPEKGHEYFPSVFDGEIQEQHGPNGTWTRTAF
jgi:hypothetical protein